ncbi:MAG: ATP-binding protein [Thermodesulfobacteriota bacterium]
MMEKAHVERIKKRMVRPFAIAMVSLPVTALVFLALFCLRPAVSYAADPAIFILHSYHQEYPWTGGQNNAFVQALERSSSLQTRSFYTEYLDTKRAKFDSRYEVFFVRYLVEKYRGFQPSLIYCTDDNALQFLVRHKKTIFPGAGPVVFSGINNLGLAKTLDPGEFVGVFEKKEIVPNISFIISVKPEVKTVHFIGDASSTYEAIKIEAEKEMRERFPRLRYAFHAENRLAVLLNTLKSLNEGVVLLTTIGGLYDEQGELVPLPRAIAQIRMALTLPIISMEDVYVRKGILGGYVTSSQAQGEAAAAIAGRILAGTPPQRIGSLLESPNIHMYHYGELKRLGIPLSRLPEGSILLERPQTFFTLYKRQILAALFWVALQTVIIIFLMQNIVRRRQAEKNLSLANEHLEASVAERTAEMVVANAKLKKEALDRARAEERLGTVVRNLPVVLWAIDRQGLFTLSTGRGLERFGLSEGQLVGKSLFAMYAGNQAIVAEAKRALAGETFSSLLEEGGVIFENHYTPLFADGNVSGVIGIAIDVTERFSLEKRIRQAQRMEAIGTLAGGIAHDFNNILGAIIGYAELALLDAGQGRPVTEHLAEIRRASDRAKDLVAHILTFSRQTEMRPQPMSAVPVIKEALKLLRSSLPAEIEIRQQINQEAGKIMADPVQVHQCFMNLCTNAAQAMREKGGVLTVALAEEELRADALPPEYGLEAGRYLVLSVADTGHGMDRATMGRIFDPFFSTRERGEGTGLGLSVVHGIVKSHGGGIVVESQPGQGATFRLCFPLLEQSAAESAAGIVKAPLPSGDRERVLLVDDEVPLVEMGQRILEYLGYVVTPKTSSSEALQLFAAQPEAFDLVITDQSMPGMTGVEMARQMLSLRPGLPVILCTGFSGAVGKEQARAMGIRGYVMKPLSINDLAAACQEALAGRKEPSVTA